MQLQTQLDTSVVQPNREVIMQGKVMTVSPTNCKPTERVAILVCIHTTHYNTVNRSVVIALLVSALYYSAVLIKKQLSK